MFQVKLHLQRVTAHRLDGGDLGRLHPQLGVRGDPQLSFSVAIAWEGSEVGSDLPAAIYQDSQCKLVTPLTALTASPSYLFYKKEA